MEFLGLSASKIVRLFCISMLVCQVTIGQIKVTDNIESWKFNRQVEKSVEVRHIVDSICNAYSTITFFVRNNEILDSVEYSRDLPQFLKSAFSHALPLYKNANWKTILPKSQTIRDYEIIQPFVYDFYAKQCNDTVSESQMKDMLSVDIKRGNNKISKFLLIPVDIKIYYSGY